MSIRNAGDEKGKMSRTFSKCMLHLADQGRLTLTGRTDFGKTLIGRTQAGNQNRKTERVSVSEQQRIIQARNSIPILIKGRQVIPGKRSDDYRDNSIK